MNKEYINCKLAMTSDCPYRNDNAMLNLLMSTEKPTKILSDEIIKSANLLCNKCDKFTARN